MIGLISDLFFIVLLMVVRKVWNYGLNFSKKCEDKYNEAKCVYEWKKMTKKGYTVGSLNLLCKRRQS